MLALILSWLLDSSHCARWQASHGRLACADVRLRANTCTTRGWHRFGWQRIPVCVADCGAEGPSS